jgi:hypothetical protein
LGDVIGVSRFFYLVTAAAPLPAFGVFRFRRAPGVPEKRRQGIPQALSENGFG